MKTKLMPTLNVAKNGWLLYAKTYKTDSTVFANYYKVNNPILPVCLIRRTKCEQHTYKKFIMSIGFHFISNSYHYITATPTNNDLC